MALNFYLIIYRVIELPITLKICTVSFLTTTLIPEIMCLSEIQNIPTSVLMLIASPEVLAQLFINYFILDEFKGNWIEF